MSRGQKALIAKQEAIIAALRNAQQPSEAATELLRAMKRTFIVFEQDLERLSRSK